MGQLPSPTVIFAYDWPQPALSLSSCIFRMVSVLSRQFIPPVFLSWKTTFGWGASGLGCAARKRRMVDSFTSRLREISLLLSFPACLRMYFLSAADSLLTAL